MGQNVNMQADEYEGYHQFVDGYGEEFGSFEVFWLEGQEEEWPVEAGWYWWPCFPGCTPDTDGDANGPFDTSEEAYRNAREE